MKTSYENDNALLPETLLQKDECIKYTINRLLGGGGFGITYLATQIKQLENESIEEMSVVIKELYYKSCCQRDRSNNEVKISSKDGLEEFKRLKKKFISEAKFLNKFNHPNIVEVYNVFEENNTAYIAMDYIEGADLQELIKNKGKCSLDQYLKYVIQITQALDVVHQEHILHLDISPSNILIDKEDNAQLIDFGISLAYDDTGEAMFTSKLLSGEKRGFSPPEQRYIEALKKFSPPIDIYALGATLYNCLTGNVPSQPVVSFSPEADISLSSNWEPPSKYNEEVTPVLDHVIEKAMSLKSRNRYQTSIEFRKDLLKVVTEYSKQKEFKKLVEIGDTYFQNGAYEEALDSWKQALSIWVDTDNVVRPKIQRCQLKIEEIKKKQQELEKQRKQEAIKAREEEVRRQEEIKRQKQKEQRVAENKIVYEESETKLIGGEVKHQMESSLKRKWNIKMMYLFVLIVLVISIASWKVLRPDKIEFLTRIENPFSDFISDPPDGKFDSKQEGNSLEIGVQLADSWVDKFEKAFSEAEAYLNENSSRYSLTKALSKYKEALNYIPDEDKSSKKTHLRKLIIECEERINMESQWTDLINTADQNYNSGNYIGAKKKYQDVLNLAPMSESKGFRIIRAKFEARAKQGISDCDSMLEIEAKKVLQQANIAFNAAQYDNAFELYKKIHDYGISDDTGYNNFYAKALEIIPLVGVCDSFVKKILRQAKDLKNTQEVNNLLSKCK